MNKLQVFLVCAMVVIFSSCSEEDEQLDTAQKQDIVIDHVNISKGESTIVEQEDNVSTVVNESIYDDEIVSTPDAEGYKGVDVEWTIPDTSTMSFEVSYSSLTKGVYSNNTSDVMIVHYIYGEKLNPSFDKYMHKLLTSGIKVNKTSGPIVTLTGIDYVLSKEQLNDMQKLFKESLDNESDIDELGYEWHVVKWSLHDDGNLCFEMVNSKGRVARGVTYVNNMMAAMAYVKPVLEGDISAEYIEWKSAGLFE